MPRRRSIVRPPKVVAVVALAMLTLSAGARPQPAPARPMLLVLMVVDQLRAEYPTRYGVQWTGGLRRIFDGGTVYEQTYYPYVNTVTCAGHATLATGAWPKSHGIIMNQWYDREARAIRTCTADASVTTYTYGRPADARNADAARAAGHSGAALRAQTLAERLAARWPQSRSVTLSLKPRSAIMMAGKRATSVTWHEGGWQSSTAFGPARPEVLDFVKRHPLERLGAATWQRLLPPSAYVGLDDGAGERPAKGRLRVFPHGLSVTAENFEELWEESPYADDMLGAMAVAAIQDFRLGQRDVVDFLGVSFSSTDYVGHAFGPDSHEVQDTLARLDGTIGRVLDALDRYVGRGRYVLALSSDHGVATVPEVVKATGTSAGRVPSALVRSTVEKALAGLGPGPHVARAEYTQIYLTPDTRRQLTAASVAPALAALRSTPGIAAAVWADALQANDPTVPAPLLDAIRAGHVPDRSGDLVIVPAPHWIFVLGANAEAGDGTTHGSPHAYDQHVPLAFFGGPFEARRFSDRSTPADLAPTLAATVGVTVAGTEGRVLAPMR